MVPKDLRSWRGPGIHSRLGYSHMAYVMQQLNAAQAILNSANARTDRRRVKDYVVKR